MQSADRMLNTWFSTSHGCECGRLYLQVCRQAERWQRHAQSGEAGLLPAAQQLRQRLHAGGACRAMQQHAVGRTVPDERHACRQVQAAATPCARARRRSVMPIGSQPAVLVAALRWLLGALLCHSPPNTHLSAGRGGLPAAAPAAATAARRCPVRRQLQHSPRTRCAAAAPGAAPAPAVPKSGSLPQQANSMFDGMKQRHRGAAPACSGGSSACGTRR